jgi:hypothetical protein
MARTDHGHECVGEVILQTSARIIVERNHPSTRSAPPLIGRFDVSD